MEKFHLPTSEGEAYSRSPKENAPISLWAIYLLDWGDPEIIRLSGLGSPRRLVESATYRADLLEPMGQVAAHWQRCAALAERVAIFKFTRPYDWLAMDGAMRQLTAGSRMFDTSNESS